MRNSISNKIFMRVSLKLHDHIVAKVRRGLAEKVTGPYWFRDIDYDRDVQGFPFDPKKARALLEAEGWKLNSKGVLEKDGRPFRFKMLFFDQPVWREQVLVVQDGARQAGIDIELDGEADWPTVTPWSLMSQAQE